MSLGHQTKWHSTIRPTPTLIFYAGTFLLRYIYYTLWSLDGTYWTKSLKGINALTIQESQLIKKKINYNYVRIKYKLIQLYI